MRATLAALLALLAACPLAGRASGADALVYVSVPAEKKIVRYRLDSSTGALNRLGEQAVPGEPAALATDPARRILFASLRPEGKLCSFRIGEGGALTPVSVVTAGPDPAHLHTDRTGRYLLAAYYVDAKVTVHPVGKGGELDEKAARTVKTAEKAHAVVPDRSNRWVFAPHTGPNAVFQFAFDPEKGELRPGKRPRLATGPNTGPRHLAWHPAEPLAYVINEQGGSVTRYRLDEEGGGLSPLETVSTLPADWKGANATAEVKVHPSGKFLYGSNRGHDSLAVFRLGAGGRLEFVGTEPTEPAPRSFDLDPAGKFLVAAGEGSGKLAVYRVDAQTGRLKRIGTTTAGGRAWWVLAVEGR